MLKLAKLEGDAAFFYAELPPNKEADLASFTSVVTKIRRHFLERQVDFEAERLCNCDSCIQAKQLTLKFVAHVGEVAFQRDPDLKTYGKPLREDLEGLGVVDTHYLDFNEIARDHPEISERSFFRNSSRG